MDKIIEGYIRKYPNAVIVNLGCGLDTTFAFTSPFGIMMANKMVIKSSGMSSNLELGLRKAREVALWDNRIEILGEQVFFSQMKN